MPKWKKNQKEFTVALDENSGSHICRVPKPIVEKFGIPHSIKFEIKKNGTIIVVAGKEKK